MESLPPGIDPANTPIAPNPNGDPPNFIDPPSLGPAVLAVGLTLIISSSVFVTLRLITNFKTVGRLGLDDCPYISVYRQWLWHKAGYLISELTNTMLSQVSVSSPI